MSRRALLMAIWLRALPGRIVHGREARFATELTYGRGAAVIRTQRISGDWPTFWAEAKAWTRRADQEPIGPVGRKRLP